MRLGDAWDVLRDRGNVQERGRRPLVLRLRHVRGSELHRDRRSERTIEWHEYSVGLRGGQLPSPGWHERERPVHLRLGFEHIHGQDVSVAVGLRVLREAVRSAGPLSAPSTYRRLIRLNCSLKCPLAAAARRRRDRSPAISANSMSAPAMAMKRSLEPWTLAPLTLRHLQNCASVIADTVALADQEAAQQLDGQRPP